MGYGDERVRFDLLASSETLELKLARSGRCRVELAKLAAVAALCEGLERV